MTAGVQAFWVLLAVVCTCIALVEVVCDCRAIMVEDFKVWDCWFVVAAELKVWSPLVILAVVDEELKALDCWVVLVEEYNDCVLILGALSLEAVVLGVGIGLAAICTFGGGPMLSMTQLTTEKNRQLWLQSHAQSSCSHNYIVYCTSLLTTQFEESGIWRKRTNTWCANSWPML